MEGWTVNDVSGSEHNPKPTTVFLDLKPEQVGLLKNAQAAVDAAQARLNTLLEATLAAHGYTAGSPKRITELNQLEVDL